MEEEQNSVVAPFDQEVTDALEKLPALIEWLSGDLELLESEEDWTRTIMNYHNYMGIPWTEPFATLSGGFVDMLLIHPPREKNYDNKQREPCRMFLCDDNRLLEQEERLGPKIRVSMRDAHTNTTKIIILTEFFG